MFTPSTPDLSALNGIYEDKQKMVRAAELAMLNSAEAISQRLLDRKSTRLNSSHMA